MASQVFRVKNRSTALPIVAGVVQGAQNFITAYQGAHRARREDEMKRAEMELRAQQVQIMRDKMNLEYGPVKVRLGVLNMLDELDKGGADVPSGVRSRAWNDFMDTVAEKPNAIPHITQAAQTHRARQFSLPVGSVSDELPMAPDPKFQNSGADTEIKFGGMEINTEAPSPKPKSYPDVELSRGEFDLWKSKRNAQAQERIAQTRGQVQLGIENVRNMSREQLQARILESQRYLKELELAAADQRNQRDNDTRLKAVDKQVKARSAGQSGPNLDRKSILSRIETLQRQKGELYKPNSLGMTTPASIAKQQEAWYDQEIKALEQKLGAPAAQPAKPGSKAPAKPASKPAATKVPSSGTVRRWDPLKEPEAKFKTGDIVDVVSGKGAGKRIKVTSDDGDWVEVK